MSSSKAKKSSKGDQIPKPISIKKEKIEDERKLQPISHYIDDRLELVKQIFGTLKPKTIMNLAPEFLKKTPLDEIEELCLEELLCLSTKRLKSIIENTKCPTDTESSEDSDVEHKEEHISLEEISSDSDIGGQESRKTKKKLRSKKTSNGNENKESGGQMSVLELLELQARARAIRSQLAMEPITKIEVKSDDDNDEVPAEQVQRKEKEKRSTKKKDSGKRKPQESAIATSSQPDSSSREQQAPRKKIKIKRNYRQTSRSPEKEVPPPASAPSPKTLVTVNDINKLPRSKSRSASPDVIPIQTEPETLLISDSTDDEATKKKTIETTKQVEADPPAPVVESEPEEGEVRDEPEEPAKPDEPANPEDSTESEAAAISKELECNKPEESDKSDTLDVTIDKEQPSEEAPSANIPTEPKKPIASEPTALDDEDQNDDVISIGGDLEMIEEMTKDDHSPPVSIKSEKKEKMQDPEELDNDVISLDTSEDERDKLQQPDSESWRSRYMKSSKVSQVLAESRLGKRVRDKLKKSKRSKVTASEEQSKVEKPDSFTSKHEDGSIEQYQELLQHRQRKTSNSSKGDK
ncbi:enolase-phosphatase E1 [Drosophila yakuba]|uniref:Uncharacterized protein n=1 Tax=Drosophila yakuba TaxID=7245 RepID=B4PJV3_DROYA|nr:enolase-phosphatase E1 [Drosophila yakuba]EDW94722.1 uncharacterized protein Dyak_GE19910 [Drosophila yakuba]